MVEPRDKLAGIVSNQIQSIERRLDAAAMDLVEPLRVSLLERLHGCRVQTKDRLIDLVYHSIGSLRY